MSKNCAIILAAGRGRRMGTKINKQFLNLQGRPILYYTLKAFSNNSNIDEIILVAAEDEISYCKEEIIDKYGFNKVSKIVIGGKERQDSVLNGLKAIGHCDIVLIHDGARPFVEPRIIEEGIEYALKHGASACGVKPKDTIKIKNKEGFSRGTLDRRELVCIQTPQCFKYNTILEFHNKIKRDNLMVTDDTTAIETYGGKVYLYDGSYNNIKITTVEDLIIGEKILDCVLKKNYE